MLVTVVPQVEKLYKDLHQTLPYHYTFIVGASQFVTKFWWMVLIAIGLSVYFAVQYFRTPAGCTHLICQA